MWRLPPCCHGCDRAAFNRSDRSFEQAEQKRSAQDYRSAITFYEKALDNDKKAADAHFRMGMIYDANLDDPVGAVHHFKRYMEMQPNGAHAKEARANLDRIELKLATSLAGGTLINHTEALKLAPGKQGPPRPVGATPGISPLPAALRPEERPPGRRRPARPSGTRHRARAPTSCSQAIRWRASRANFTARRPARRTSRTPT